MEQIHNFYKEQFNISDKDWKIFSSKLVRYQYSPKETILKKGETENYLSFVELGMVRLFIPKEENDLTFGFVFSGAFLSAYDSFLTQSPSTYSIEAISETILWRLSYADLQDVYQESSIGNLIGRKAAEDLFLKKSQRELSLLNESAEKRYLNLFSEKPELIRQIPLKYIASYIGVTPQTLSRIRKRIT